MTDRRPRDRATVAIVGGGPAGCATALGLIELGVKDVVIVTDTRSPTLRVGESVPPEIQLLLRQLRLWDQFCADGHDPTPGTMSAWGSWTLGHNDFVLNPHGQGWHLDRSRFDRTLLAETEARGVQVRREHWRGQVEELPGSGAGFRLNLRDSALEAAVVVDATGTQARLARSLGASRDPHDRLSCATVFFGLPPGSSLPWLGLIEATTEGWWYAARLPHRRVAVVAAADPDHSRRAALATLEGWLGAARHTRHVSAVIDGAEPEVVRPVLRTAPSFLLRPVSGQRWLAVGDAASTFDPIAAQGIYKALAGGLDAARALVQVLGGEPEALDRYAGLMAEQFEDYLANRDHVYGLERRWETSPFWARRRAHSRSGRRP